MPEDKIAAEPKPTRKRRKKSLKALKMFVGNANVHVCQISTREYLTIPGFEAQMVKLSCSAMRWLMQELADKGIEPSDLHVAFELTLDTDDHPPEEAQPVSTLVN